ncbi:MAG: YhjD/YihY/BrkB family envelope integrity protein [Alphaproteobacteria bacterium]
MDARNSENSQPETPTGLARHGANISIVWKRLSGTVPLRLLPARERYFAQAVRVVMATLRDITTGTLSLHAMSLVYTTLLSLVPLLAVSFSVLKGFGVHNQIEPAMLGALEPLGREKAVEITDQIIAFVDNVNVSVLGGVGLAILIVTILSLMRKVEGAFNGCWRVSRGRTIGASFTTYLSVILIGPVLVFSSLTMTATLANNDLVTELSKAPGVDALIDWGGRLIPYLILLIAFSFLYVFIPNTRVRLRPAFIGAGVAALLWQLASWGFAELVAQSGSYAIYAAFATMVIFMFWLYISWLILLFGASVAFYVQKPQYASIAPGNLKLSGRARETIAIAVMREIASRFNNGGKGWTVSALADRLDVPDAAVDWTVTALIEGGLLVESDQGKAVLMPARAPDKVPIYDVIELIRRADDTGTMSNLPLPKDSQAAQILAELDGSRQRALEGQTVQSLVYRPDDVSSTN